VTVNARRIAGLLLAAAIVVADRAIKWLVLHRTNIYQPVELTSFFRLTYTQNFGVSLGLLTASTQEMRLLLVGVTLAIAIGVFVWIFRERRLIDILALGLVLGGALGNIIDRATIGFVTDYADLHFGEWRPFLIFNLADVAISTGVVVILARSLFWSEKPDPAVKPAPEIH
jgi:signal peptidase II